MENNVLTEVNGFTFVTNPNSPNEIWLKTAPKNESGKWLHIGKDDNSVYINGAKIES